MRFLFIGTNDFVYVYESEINQMTLGEKIKYIRTFRKMTQQELGEAIGLDAKGAANRIAQYETNYRVPKKDMVYDIAKVLRIYPANLNCYVPGSLEDIISTLIWMDETNSDMIKLFEIGISNTPYNVGTSITAEYDDNDNMPSTPLIGFWIDEPLLNDFMEKWHTKKKQLNTGEITHTEYLDWKIRYPET